MIRRTFRLVGVIVLLAGPVLAAEPAKSEFGRTGWYVGGGATYAFESFSSGGVSVDDSAGFKLQGGYRAHPNFAAEVDVDYVNGFDVSAGGYDLGRVRGVATTVNGKGYLTTGRVQPYGVAGIGGLYVAGFDSSLDNILGLDGGFVTRFGGGLDVYATEHFVLNAEATYDLPTGDVSSLRFVPVTLGAQYRF